MSTPTYYKGSDLPDLAITWTDTSGAVIDFSTGWTFQLKLAAVGSLTAVATKTTGIAGAATAPNVTVAWATSGDLNSLAAGLYVCQIKATRTADSKERFMSFDLRLKAAIT